MWPKPQYVGNSSQNLSFLSRLSFKITTNLKVKCDIIDENIKLYTNILFPPKIAASGDLSINDTQLIELNIELTANDKCPSYPDSNMDETCI